MKIDISKIKNIKLAKLELELSESVNAAAYDYQEIKPVEPLVFSGVIENLGSILQLTGRVRGRLQLVCSRCLEPFEWSFVTELNESYTNQPSLAAADEDEEIILFEGDVIDITPQLLKQIFLEIPMKILCSEDCRGLCSVCGANLNQGECGCDRREIDIRLIGLKDILDNMKEEV